MMISHPLALNGTEGVTRRFVCIVVAENMLLLQGLCKSVGVPYADLGCVRTYFLHSHTTAQLSYGLFGRLEMP